MNKPQKDNRNNLPWEMHRNVGSSLSPLFSHAFTGMVPD